MARTDSPLRYPGGKACLYELISTTLRLNDIERGHYVEPYAGGCGLALSLLFGGHVADIHINDIDPSIWAFWHCALNETDALIEKISDTPVTIEEWKRQREIHRGRDPSDKLALGFSAFFLNRTNRSGVIEGAGVIGGLDQTGNYKLDCRFNRDELIRRVRRIGKYRDSIHLSNMDAVTFIQAADKMLPARALFCIDPPYFNKGADLYTNFYRAADHAALAAVVTGLTRPWVVTYDNTPEIKALYRENRQFTFDINYSLHTKRVGLELLVASEGLRLPPELRNRRVARPPAMAA